jgi:ribonuclease Z
MLGTGAGVPTPERGLPSIALVYRGSIVLLDAGEGTQRAMSKAGLSPLKVEAIFITHLHGDHFFGLPGLLQSMAMLGRQKELLVVGPRGLKSFVEAAAEATRWLPPYPVKIVELRGGSVVRTPSGLEVEAFPVAHTIEAYGYKVVEPPRRPKVNLEAARRLGIKPGPLLGRLQRGEAVVVGGRVVRPEDVLEPQPRTVIVYTGDTAPTERIIEAARGAHVLVHDSTFSSAMAEEAYKQGHSTAADAGEAASRAGARSLVLFHVSARYRDASVLEDEARRFHPHVVVAEDMQKVVLRL